MDAAPFFSIYIDESSQTDHRFLVLGALILPQAELPVFVDALGRARLPELPAAEMKWGKVSKSKLEAYERFVRVFFKTPAAHFHSLVVDATQHRPAKFNGGDRETGFNKETHQRAALSHPTFPRLPRRAINFTIPGGTANNHQPGNAQAHRPVSSLAGTPLAIPGLAKVTHASTGRYLHGRDRFSPERPCS